MKKYKCQFCGKGEICYLQMPDEKVPDYCVCEDAEYADREEDEDN